MSTARARSSSVRIVLQNWTPTSLPFSLEVRLRDSYCGIRATALSVKRISCWLQASRQFASALVHTARPVARGQAHNRESSVLEGTYIKRPLPTYVAYLSPRMLLSLSTFTVLESRGRCLWCPSLFGITLVDVNHDVKRHWKRSQIRKTALQSVDRVVTTWAMGDCSPICRNRMH
jgi:hypothetical protein